VGARRGRSHQDLRGRAVQIDPSKSTLKAPGLKPLKLNCDVLLSTSAFKFDLRRYIEESDDAARVDLLACKAGAYTRSHFSST
jgi:hypothetical protein